MKLIRDSFLSRSFTILGVAIAYWISARLALHLAFQHTNISPVWPPAGIALAAILLLGYRSVPAVLIGAFLVNYTTGLPVFTSAFISIGNTLEALTGAYLIRRLIPEKRPFEKASSVFLFLLIAVICTMVSATIGTSSVYFGGFGQGGSYSYLWVIWWLGDTVGVIVVTPFLCCWKDYSAKRKRIARPVEALLFVALLSFLSLSIFHGWFPSAEALLYLTVPLIVLSAFRFEQLGATASIVVLSSIAIWATIRGYGPFADQNSIQSLLVMQSFIGVIAATALTIASVVSERDESLRTVQSQLREKEVLLSEIHHRVKNNLQIISSLLNMQLNSSGATHPARALLLESRNRIRSMAMIHERLYESNTFSEINLGPYLKDLVEAIYRSYAINRKPIQLLINCEDAFVQIDKAVPVALIANEIVSNSIKHAFDQSDEGQIKVKLNKKNGDIILTLGDNGCGLPAGIKLEETESLGLKLIALLTKQLDASVKIDRSAGTEFEITFQ